MLLLVSSADQLRAAPITVYFSGTIDVQDVLGLLPSEITTGSSFFGTFNYDPDLVNGQAPFGVLQQRGEGAEFGISLFVKGYAFQPGASSSSWAYFIDKDTTILHYESPSEPGVEHLDYFGPATSDSIHAQTQHFQLPFPDRFDLWTTVSLDISDPSGATFSVERLEDGILFNASQKISLQLMGSSMAFTNVWPSQSLGGFSIIGNIDNLWSEPARIVPEPSGLVLLALGAVAFVAVQFRRRA